MGRWTVLDIDWGISISVNIEIKSNIDSLAQSLMSIYSPDFLRLSPIIDNGRINVNLGLVLTVGERRVLRGGK